MAAAWQTHDVVYNHSPLRKKVFLMNPTIAQWYTDHESAVSALAHDIWCHPENFLQEFYACQQVANFMTKEGFAVQTCNVLPNSLDAPNTVYATYGSGKPVIGIVGEYDALEALGQEAVPYKSPIASQVTAVAII